MEEQIHFSVLSSSFNHIIFDLDGTLTQSAPGIVSSVRYSLEKFGIKDQSDEDLMKFIGPPLTDSYMSFYGFDKEKADKAIEHYRDYYADKGIFENDLYENIPQALKVLKQAGKKLYIATSKPQVYMKKIIEHFKINEYFEDVAGGDLEEKNNGKDFVIGMILKRNNLLEDVKQNKVLMVGDRKHDIIGARKNNIPTLAVLWGYGNMQEFIENKADYFAESVLDIIK